MGKGKRMGMSLLLGSGMVVAGPVIAGCGSDLSPEEWGGTEGTIGRINMDAVQDAFKKSKSMEAFEKRLNEIYEGDGIVLVRAKEDGGRRVIEAFEDLNNDGQMDPTQDDLLFTITNAVSSDNIQGHGANSYHNSFGGTGNFLFSYLVFSSLTGGGYGYQTAPSRLPQMRKGRDNYRDSPSFTGGLGGGPANTKGDPRSQVKRNSDYFSKQKGYNARSYNRAGNSLSRSRASYIGTQKSSGAFKSSNTGVRAGFGKYGGQRGFFGSVKSHFGGRGGSASGAGGGQVIIKGGRFVPLEE